VDYRIIASGFLDSLRSIGVFDAMLAGGMRRVPLRTRAVSVTSAFVGDSPVEAAVKPLSEIELAGTNIEPVKSTCLVTATRELFELGGGAAQAFLSRELRSGVVAATDAKFLSILSAAATSAVSTGEDVESIFADLRAMSTAVAVSSMSALFLVMNPQRLKLMALIEGTAGRAFPDVTYRGGTVAGINVLASDQLDDSEALLVDAAQIAGDSDAIVLDVARHAALDLDGGASPAFSTWQRNSVALRTERWFGAEVVGDAAVALLTSVSWGEGSTP